MKHLSIPKIGNLGILLTLVLAFSVIDTADALSFTSQITRTDKPNVSFVYPGETFKVEFTVSLVSDTANPVETGTTQGSSSARKNTDVTHAGETVTPENASDFYYYDRTSGDTTTRTWVTKANAYHYNEEKISIDPDDNSDISIVSIEDHLVTNSSGNAYELSETAIFPGTTTKQLTSTTITVKCKVSSNPTVGEHTFTVTDETADADRPLVGDKRVPKATSPTAFKITVVQRIPAPGNIPTLSSVSATSIIRAHDTRTPITATLADAGSGSAQWYEVDFAIASGSSGTLSENQDGTGNTGTSLTAYTDTSRTATVYLRPSGSTTKVQVTVAGRSPGSTTSTHSQTVTLFYQSFNLEADQTLDGPGGNGQSGLKGTRLANPFVVKVTDGTNSGISGQAVTFYISGQPSGGAPPTPPTTANDPALFPDTGSGFRAEPVTAGGTAGNDDVGYNRLVVRTDSRGEAKVFLRLENVSGSHTVTATFSGITREFTARALASVGTLVLRVDTENSVQEQSTARLTTASKPLVVRVLAGGVSELSGQAVRFTTADGALTPRREAQELNDNDRTNAGSPQSTPTDRTILTNARGEAWIDYTGGNTEGPVTIFARAYAHTPSGNNVDVTSFSRIDSANQVIFRVNVGGSTTPPPTPPPTTTTPTPPTVSVSPTSISGAPGSTQTLTITGPTTAQLTIGGLNFSVAGGTVSPSSGTGNLTSTLTLPSTVGTYSLTVNDAGTTVQTVSVNVTTATTPTQTTGTLSISVPFSGAPGSTQTATLTATGSDGTAASGVTVTLAVTNGGGTFNPASVTTGDTGTATSTLTRGTTAGTNYFATATATGYTEARTRITITGGSTPPTTTTPTTPAVSGDPSSLTINGQATRSGVTVNQALAAPLVVEVLDSNGRSVAEARVVFQVKTGQGRLSQRGNGRAIAVETDSRGYARATYTPLSANSTVEARVGGVTERVTFTITTGAATPDTGTSGTAGAKTYKRGDAISLSSDGILRFTDKRTVNGTVYTCVSDEECVIAYGTLSRGEIQATAVPKVEAKTYKRGDAISLSPEGVLRFTDKHTVNGTVYTCVSSGECVVAYGTLSKGEIQVSMATASIPSDASRPIDPEVLLNAANRPPMLWVDGGSLYALVGADVQEFAIGVENVQNLAVSGNKVYWTERTGENAGTINAMNLDGTGAKQLVSIKAVPQGIAVDSVGKRLYWTNSHGWIQSSNLQGTARRNVAKGLSNPMGIAVAAGKTVYWTEEGPSSPELLNGHTGQSVPGVSVAISGNTLYWTQRTGENAGTIHSVNLNGTGAKHLVSIKAVPMGITVDPVGKRLYWTNSHGWIQSSNLQGTARRNVAKGLGSPGGIVLSANIKAPATPTTPTKTPTPAKPNYDVDGSGTVDNADLFLVSLAVGTNNAKYDLNGDGTVNDKDIALVRDNRDNGAAAAPMVVGVKLTAEQVDRLQAQIDLLIASGDRSPDALKTLVYLQQLIATARPEKTQLLANYPNPFNPETWIPYELATDTDVRITIYNAQGVVIRTLPLGQQSAGYYTDRERAAYWDGRNALGEQVASGVYFYQLETDEMSSLRKMVILK